MNDGQSEGVAKKRDKGAEVEVGLVRSAFAHPHAFQSSLVTARHFDDRVLGRAWEAVRMCAPSLKPGESCDAGSFLLKMRSLGATDMDGPKGIRWVQELLGGHQPANPRYAIRELVPYLHERQQVRLYKDTFGDLLKKDETEVQATFKDFTREANKVRRADLSATDDASIKGMVDRRNEKPRRIIPIGQPEIDVRIGGGLGPGDCIVIGGNTGDGKSYHCYSVSIARAKEGHRTLYISLEDSEDVVHDRLVSYYTSPQMSSRDIRAMRVVNEAVRDAQGVMMDALHEKLYVEALRKGTIDHIVKVIREHAYADGVDLVIIDYIQAIRHDDPEITDKLRIIPEAVDAIKEAASECGIVVMLCSQYHRDKSKEPPTIHSFKYSGDLENQAEVAVLLHRAEQTQGGRKNLYAIIGKLKHASMEDDEMNYVVTRDQITGHHRTWEKYDGPIGPQQEERAPNARGRSK